MSSTQGHGIGLLLAPKTNTCAHGLESWAVPLGNTKKMLCRCYVGAQGTGGETYEGKGRIHMAASDVVRAVMQDAAGTWLHLCT